MLNNVHQAFAKCVFRASCTWCVFSACSGCLKKKLQCRRWRQHWWEFGDWTETIKLRPEDRKNEVKNTKTSCRCEAGIETIGFNYLWLHHNEQHHLDYTTVNMQRFMGADLHIDTRPVVWPHCWWNWNQPTRLERKRTKGFGTVSSWLLLLLFVKQHI